MSEQMNIYHILMFPSITALTCKYWNTLCYFYNSINIQRFFISVGTHTEIKKLNFGRYGKYTLLKLLKLRQNSRLVNLYSKSQLCVHFQKSTQRFTFAAEKANTLDKCRDCSTCMHRWVAASGRRLVWGMKSLELASIQQRSRALHAFCSFAASKAT